MSLPDVVPCDRPTVVTITAPLVHQCPHREETDHGHVTITWTTDGATLELHSLAKYLASWSASVISHEYLTDTMAHALGTIPGVVLNDLSTSWKTAGMDVVVKTDLVR